MRIRRAAAATAVGALVTLGAMAVPAQAAPPASTSSTTGTSGVQLAAASWHFYSSHYSAHDCAVAGHYWKSLHPTWKDKCEFGPSSDGIWKYHLYMWY